MTHIELIPATAGRFGRHVKHDPRSREFAHEELPETAIKELRSIASRTHWLARSATDDQISILADLSRKCAVDSFVEALRGGEAPKRR